MKGLKSLSIQDLLEQEEKPVFVIDIQALPHPPLYFNPYLRSIDSLEHAILDLWAQADLSQILGERIALSSALLWCTESAGTLDGFAHASTFEGFRWVAYTIGKRYRVITGDTFILAPEAKTFSTSENENVQTLIEPARASTAEFPTRAVPYIPGNSVRLSTIILS